MTRLPLIFAIALLAMPAMAATRPAPAKPAAAKPASVPATVSAGDLMRQAQDASSKGDKDLALRLAQAAIVADPARPGSYVVLGDIYAGSGQPDYARSFYESALGIDPSEPNALKALAALAHGSTVNAAR
jgi:Tfp pilus assembly protein PilF